MAPARPLLWLSVVLAACAAPDIGPTPEVSWLPPDMEALPPAPVPVSGESYPLNLVTVLRLAGTKPLAIESARAEAQEATAEEEQALSLWIPTLRPQIRFLRHEGAEQASPGLFFNTDKQQTYAGGALDLRLELSEAWYQRLSAAQRTRAAMLGVRASQQVNIGRAIELYYELVQESAALRIAERAREHAAELVTLSEARERSGRAVPAEVLRAQAFLTATEGQHAAIEARVQTASAQLAALLLLPEDADLLSVETEVTPIKLPESELSLPQMVERAMSHRPDLQQLQALAQAADVDHSQAAHGWLLPDVHVGASLAGFGANFGTLEDQERYWAGLMWELEFGSIAETRAADARRRGAQLRIERLRQEIRADLQGARARLVSTVKQMAAASRETSAAQAALTLVTARHRQGQALLVELLDAQRADVAAGIRQVHAIAEHNRAQFDLRRLLGGGTGDERSPGQ